MRERIFLKKCTCNRGKDGGPCGKDEYSLGNYRGFELTQKPFYDGWAIYAEITNPDDLDKLLMQNNTFTNKFFLDTETSSHFTLEQCEESVISDVDNHWARKQELLDKCHAGEYKVAPIFAKEKTSERI